MDAAATTALIDGAEGALGPPFDDVDEAASKGAGCCLDSGLAKGPDAAGRPRAFHPPRCDRDRHSCQRQPARQGMALGRCQPPYQRWALMIWSNSQQRGSNPRASETRRFFCAPWVCQDRIGEVLISKLAARGVHVSDREKRWFRPAHAMPAKAYACLSTGALWAARPRSGGQQGAENSVFVLAQIDLQPRGKAVGAALDFGG